jgi:hypothetical protein
MPPPTAAPPPPPGRQLRLPLEAPPGPAPPALTPDLAILPAHRIWATLAPPDRQHVRQTALRVLQEIAAHANHERA